MKGTEWIPLEDWTCFVGLNESGKTNLLLPLWKFNPADPSTEIDLLLDYPRDEYSLIADDDSDKADKLREEHFITTLFFLSDDEVQELEKQYRQSQINSQTGAAEPENIDAEEGQPQAAADDIPEPAPPEPFGFTSCLLIAKDYKGRFWVYLSDEEGNAQSEDIEEGIGKEVFEFLCNSIPKFIYYSDYGNLDSDLFLPHVKADLARIDSLSGKERMKARTLKVLFSYLNLNPDEILTLGKETQNDGQKTKEQIESEARAKQERFARLDSAGSKLTKRFREWWRQGNYVFTFNADGDYFRIFVSDDERPEKIELESRSRGLQWFFSFFLVFLAESEDEHKECILLLDEPGLSLHPNAQGDLIRFFEELSQDNQIIYTTHLPFLVDHNHVDRVRAVFSENGATKAASDLSKADKERRAIQPVNAAIGISAAQSLLVGCQIVIVEGVSDQFYLSMIKSHLIATGKIVPKLEMVFIPVGGVKGVKPVVSIVQGSQADLPIVVLDADAAGLQARRSLSENFYADDADKVLTIDSIIDEFPSAEIEDLIPTEHLGDCFDRLYRTEDGLDIKSLREDEPIIPQLEAFAKQQQLELPVGWKVELSKRVKQRFDGKVDAAIETKWQKLFELLQAQK